jgi:hypothetical protein
MDNIGNIKLDSFLEHNCFDSGTIVFHILLIIIIPVILHIINKHQHFVWYGAFVLMMAKTLQLLDSELDIESNIIRPFGNLYKEDTVYSNRDDGCFLSQLVLNCFGIICVLYGSTLVAIKTKDPMNGLMVGFIVSIITFGLPKHIFPVIVNKMRNLPNTEKIKEQAEWHIYLALISVMILFIMFIVFFINVVLKDKLGNMGKLNSLLMVRETGMNNNKTNNDNNQTNNNKKTGPDISKDINKILKMKESETKKSNNNNLNKNTLN